MTADWLSGTPAANSAQPARRLFRIVNGSTPKSGETQYWDGNIPWVTPDDLGKIDGSVVSHTRRAITEAGLASCGTTMVPPGSVLVSTRAPIGYVAIAGTALCTNQGCKSLVATAPTHAPYYYYVFAAATPELRARGRGTTFQELSTSEFSEVRVPAPDYATQTRIADFLDRKTAAIDALIAKKERLIELLEEKRQALITQAVTKGLDPNVPMKDSGIEWLGEIPAHWSVTKPKFACSRIVDGVHHTPNYVDDGVPFVTVKNLTAGPGISLEDTKFVSEADHAQLIRRAHPERGDVLISKDGTLGVTRVIETETAFSIFVSVALLKLRPNLLRPWFLRYCFESDALWQQFESRKSGSGLKHLILSDIGDVVTPCPPLHEQDSIVRATRQRMDHIEKTRDSILDQVGRLREYRQALITAAVTGQLDVSEAS
ncbi:MAG: restriction endonuclease subunit S [Sandaracinaceae bacterium]